MNEFILRHIDGLIGQVCCLQTIGKDRSLNLGFGEAVRHKSSIAEADHGAWEIGTYYCSWRIVHENLIACGSNDTVGGVEELRQKIRDLEWGRFSAIRHLSEFDLRVEFENGMCVDFLATISDNDEVVHIFCPGKFVLEFSLANGWRAGPSDQPWNEKGVHPGMA